MFSSSLDISLISVRAVSISGMAVSIFSMSKNYESGAKRGAKADSCPSSKPCLGKKLDNRVCYKATKLNFELYTRESKFWERMEKISLWFKNTHNFSIINFFSSSHSISGYLLNSFNILYSSIISDIVLSLKRHSTLV